MGPAKLPKSVYCSLVNRSSEGHNAFRIRRMGRVHSDARSILLRFGADTAATVGILSNAQCCRQYFIDMELLRTSCLPICVCQCDLVKHCNRHRRIRSRRPHATVAKSTDQNSFISYDKTCIVNDTIAIQAGTAADLAHVCEHWLAMFEEVGKYFERDFPPDWRSVSNRTSRGEWRPAGLRFLSQSMAKRSSQRRVR